MVHGKVEPKIIRVDKRTIQRRTGTKVITITDGQDVKMKNQLLYEAQTDLLATIATSPNVGSWEELIEKFQGKFPAGNKQVLNTASALALLIQTLGNTAFKTFERSVLFLGSTYYRCEDIILPLWELVDFAYPESAVEMQRFAIANGRDDDMEMLEAAKAVSSLATE